MSEAFPVRISRRPLHPSSRRADRCNATWGIAMRIAQFVFSRATLASAALLSLALLAGCQSKPDASGATNVAGAGEQDGANTTQLSANPMPNIEGEMLRVGDRVHFELDRYELT